MSKIGKSPIALPSGVTLHTVDNHRIHVKGPKGELFQYVNPAIQVIINEAWVTLERKTDQKTDKALHGLYRALLNNMIIGVSEGFKRTLELVGVGYKASVKNNVLELGLGYSHSIFFVIPQEMTMHVEIVKGKNPLVHLEGIDKQLVGQVAAKIKALRKVEPYKGKGIKFLGESIRRKAGKSTTKK